MKVAHLLLAALLLAGTAAPMTGCNKRVYTEVEAPADPSKPKQIGVITVTVIDNNSKPVSGANVKLTDGSGKEIMPATKTGADGAAGFKNVPTGKDYVITAESGGVTGSQSGLGIDNESPLMVKVMLVPADTGKGTIMGSVVDGLSKLPLDGATVSVAGTQNTVKSQADGSFVLSNVPVGSPRVVAIMPGYRENSASVVLKGGRFEMAALALAPAGDATRLGHTVITTTRAILEFDRQASPTGSTKLGAYQARNLANGNFLIVGGGGAAEVTPGASTVWSYKPLFYGRLSNPQGVFKTASGNIFIADTGNNRILEVSKSQAVQRTIKGEFNHPIGVERLEATGTTLVADTGNSRIVEVDDNGTPIWGVGGDLSIINKPTFATQLPNGNILIADTGNHRVLEITKAHGFVWMYGGDGKRETCFLPNSAVRLPNGRTLIADTGNNRVIEVDAKGAITWRVENLEQPTYAERI